MDCCWNFISEHFILTTVITLIAGTWFYSYLTCGVCKSKARMDGKTVIITGANTGLGKATALGLARRGARVILACRNLDKANSAREEIIMATSNKNVVVKQLDLSLMSSVRKFADEINKSEHTLDVLIHNAGIALSGRNVTSEGLQMVWATNHFGPFLLTHLLIDLLKKTVGSRIIVVSSNTHYLGSVSLKNPNPVEETSGYSLYFNSKFANVIFTNELARRLQGTGVTANSLHPGVVYSNIFDDLTLFIRMFFAALSKVYWKTADQGAQTTVFLSVSEEVAGVSGKYYHDCREFSPARKSRDLEYAKTYWEVCKEIVKLKPTDPHI